ncbi:5'-3' exonuclease [Nakamurella deserti]|uniref:5'-3' exonuclease n=1 Tax=Nakamurella deserti TaxID=2164074 RepID=UPI0014795944|nr:5'-3' exonuclease H3TH domain-containing protein [Nakamurella deserti]
MTAHSAAPTADTGSGVVLAVDGNSILHRAFHSQAGTGLRAADGSPMWAIRGLIGQLVEAVDRVAPDQVVVGFDDAASSLRRQRWTTYKAQRAPKPETLVSQLALAVEMVRDLGVPVVVPTGLEADDVLAAVAARAADTGGRAVLMTSDRDAFALISPHTSVLRMLSGGVEGSPLLTPERLHLMTGIHPGQYLDYAALRGDASDNLPGVRGVGPKTAARLLAAVGTAAAAFDDLDGGGTLVADAVGSTIARRLAEPESRAAWELNCLVMAPQPGVELPAPGGWPLAVESVRHACRVLQMPATTGRALRVLAHHDAPVGTDPVAWSAPAAEVTRWSDGGRMRFPALKGRPPVTESAQLSLFGI